MKGLCMASFTVSISPTTGNGNRDYEVKVQSNGGFEDLVDLEVSLDPSADSSLADFAVSVPASGFATTTCTVGNVIQQTEMTIRGTCGALEDSDSVSIGPGSIEVSVLPATGNGNRDYTATVLSVDDFEGLVDLVAFLSDGEDYDEECYVETPVSVPKGSSVQATCTVGNVIHPGTTLTITGTYEQNSIEISDSDSASIQHGSFTVDVSPNSGGDDADYDITVTSVDDFEGLVDLDESSLSPETAGSYSLWPTTVSVEKNSPGETSCHVDPLVESSATLTIKGTYMQSDLTIDDQDSATISA